MIKTLFVSKLLLIHLKQDKTFRFDVTLYECVM